MCYHTFSELAADAVEAPEGGGGRRMKSYKPLIVSLVVPERMPLEFSADAYDWITAGGAMSADDSAAAAYVPAARSAASSAAIAAASPVFHFIRAPSRPVHSAEGAPGASPARSIPGRVHRQPEHRSIQSWPGLSASRCPG